MKKKLSSEAAVLLGRKGGRARARKMTAEQRSQAARKAVQARWVKAHAHAAGCRFEKTGLYTRGCAGCRAEARKFVAEERMAKR